MIKPISIKSSLEFIIVGPLGRSEEGIMIKSNTVDIDLIGTANLVYHEGHLPDDNIRDHDNRIKYYWSHPFTISERRTKVLFCYRELSKNIISARNFMGHSINQNIDQVRKELDRFIENSIIELQKMSYSKDSNLSFKPTINESKILWNISPLILVCMSN